jgi:hypothetical protein
MQIIVYIEGIYIGVLFSTQAKGAKKLGEFERGEAPLFLFPPSCTNSLGRGPWGMVSLI